MMATLQDAFTTKRLFVLLFRFQMHGPRAELVASGITNKFEPSKGRAAHDGTHTYRWVDRGCLEGQKTDSSRIDRFGAVGRQPQPAREGVHPWLHDAVQEQGSPGQIRQIARAGHHRQSIRRGNLSLLAIKFQQEKQKTRLFIQIHLAPILPPLHPSNVHPTNLDGRRPRRD